MTTIIFMKSLIKFFAIFFIIAIGIIFFALSNQIGGWKMLIVSSGSMEPTIHTGSLIVSQYKHPSTLQKNDIITFIPPTKQREFVTHRITQITKTNNLTTIKTKGDKNHQDDNWVLAGGSVVGKVIFTIPYAGYIFSFTQTKIGIALFILLPTIYLIINEITYSIELIKQHRKKSIEKHEILVTLFIFFLNIVLFSPQQTYAYLSDTTNLTNNSFTIEFLPSATPTPTPCGDNTTITISGNGAGSHNSVSITNTNHLRGY